MKSLISSAVGWGPLRAERRRREARRQICITPRLITSRQSILGQGLVVQNLKEKIKEKKSSWHWLLSCTGQFQPWEEDYGQPKRRNQVKNASLFFSYKNFAKFCQFILKSCDWFIIIDECSDTIVQLRHTANLSILGNMYCKIFFFPSARRTEWCFLPLYLRGQNLFTPQIAWYGGRNDACPPRPRASFGNIEDSGAAAGQNLPCARIWWANMWNTGSRMRWRELEF